MKEETGSEKRVGKTEYEHDLCVVVVRGVWVEQGVTTITLRRGAGPGGLRNVSLCLRVVALAPRTGIGAVGKESVGRRFKVVGVVATEASSPSSSHVQLRVFGAAVHQERIAAGVHGRAQTARVLSRKVHVVVVAHVAHDLPAQQAPFAFVQRVHFLEYLRDTVRLELCKIRGVANTHTRRCGENGRERERKRGENDRRQSDGERRFEREKGAIALCAAIRASSSFGPVPQRFFLLM